MRYCITADKVAIIQKLTMTNAGKKGCRETGTHILLVTHRSAQPKWKTGKKKKNTKKIFFKKRKIKPERCFSEQEYKPMGGSLYPDDHITSPA